MVGCAPLRPPYAKPLGREILAGRKSLDDFAAWIADGNREPQPKSGRQQFLEGLVNRFT